jgi:hypothetical protein
MLLHKIQTVINDRIKNLKLAKLCQEQEEFSRRILNPN